MPRHHHTVFTAVNAETIAGDYTRFDPIVLQRYGQSRPTIEAAIRRAEFPKLFRFAGTLYAKNSHLNEYDTRVRAALDAVPSFGADEPLS
jgi:hypothetical protein